MGGSRCSVLLLLSLLVTASPAWSANILGLFTSHSQSHLILHMSMVKALAEEGHNVTVVSVMKPTVTHKDIHHIVIPVSDEHEQSLESQMSQMAGEKNTIISTLLRLLTGMSAMIESQVDVLSDPRFQRIYETKFDLMFMGYFLNDFQLGLAHKLQVPVIVAWMQAPIPVINSFVGNPQEISYVPIMGASAERGKAMSFVQRVENFAKNLALHGFAEVFYHRADTYYAQLFGNEPNFPTLNEVKRNISMVFTNSHLTSEGPIRPLVPASVEIGGIQIKEKPNPLPEDLAKFLNEAKNGAILLSLGSNIKGSSVKPELVEPMFKVLSGLKQRVIWKWEDLSKTPGTSPNILYKKWLPQDDILAHPNIKLFITHAGKGGITEARYHGVPMVALPIFGDQPSNADNMEKAGYGIALDLLELNEENFGASIREVLENEKYAAEIGKFSKLYRDRPLSARQSVVYWTEYVLRHKGAPHLQSPSVHMNFVAYHNLDVYALLAAVLSVLLLINVLTIRLIYRKFFVKPSPIKKSKLQ